MRRFSTIVLMAALVFALAGGTGLVAQQKNVVVANKNFTEQYVMGELMTQLLEARGFSVEQASDLSSQTLRAGMEAGDMDVAADYTGTAWMVYLGFEYFPGLTNTGLYYAVKGADSPKGFAWLNPIWNNNTYALAAWPEFCNNPGEYVDNVPDDVDMPVDTMSELAALYNANDGQIDTFIDFEFSARPDGLPALEEHYGFDVADPNLSTGAPGASLNALANNQVDVAMVFGTDAAIAENGWVVFKDDKSFFPPYDLTPYVRKDVLDEYPEIEAILNELVATFACGGEFPNDPAALGDCVAEGQSTWQELNARVDIDRLEPEDAAREYLLEHGLIEE